MRNVPALRFGIPTLDNLLGRDSGQRVVHDIWSLCLIGPDGTGKSILAMHAATEFLRSEHADSSRVIYVSTDLRSESAATTFHQFGLHCPDARDRALPGFARRENIVEQASAASPCGKDSVRLNPYTPASISKFLSAEKTDVPTMAFLDLASATAGDDWGYLARLLASLPAPEAGKAPHLLVVDALEGLELNGRHDAFGQARDRRSRVAQLMRAAHGKACLILVVEQGRPRRVPEEFATDVVIRLRVPTVGGYRRRTLEIAKARTKDHARGEHAYLIRDGSGSSTGKSQNVDDPWVDHPGHDGAERFLRQVDHFVDGRSVRGLPMSYLFVCPSIHRRYRDVMKSMEEPHKDPVKDSGGSGGEVRIGFGIPGLDEMLGAAEGGGESGWPAGRVSAIIGDRSTAKHQLGINFLAQCFRNRAGGLPLEDWGVAVLITNRADASARKLREKIATLVIGNDEKVEKVEEDRRRFIEELENHEAVFCRRLEIHDISPSVLSHIIGATVDEAKRRRRKLSGLPVVEGEGNASQKFEYWRIRLVIDDWTILRSLYRDLDSDDQFLPYTIFALNRDRVSSVFISTQAGRPNAPIDSADRRFRELHDRHLLTWHVSFSGSRRIAVTHLGRGERESPIRELRVEDRRPIVDPHFELYTDLDDHPRPVPLRVDMYARYAKQKSYVDGVDAFLRGAFSPTDDSGAIVHAFGPGDYAVQQALPYLKVDTRLDHTRVVMLDEFWEASSSGLGSQHSRRLMDLRRYLTDSLQVQAGVRVSRRVDDPYLAFRGFQTRNEAFLDEWPGIVGSSVGKARIDRVPFLRTFAFTLLYREAWEQAADRELPSTVRSGSRRRLCVRDFLENPCKEAENRSWRNFLEACVVVSREWQANRGDSRQAFSYGVSQEDYASLVLEVWLSGLQDYLEKDRADQVSPERLERLSTRNPERNPEWRFLSLLDLLKDKNAASQLYFALLLIGEATRGLTLPTDTSRPRANAGADRGGPAPAFLPAVAQRTWYSAACDLTSADSWRSWCARPLPGRFTTRGDWFLGVLAGSRSELLAHRALDLLGGRRSQEARLRGGFGLPTWKAKSDFEMSVPTDLWSAESGKGPGGFGARIGTVPLTYGEVLALGEVKPVRSYLWRSQIDRYALHRTTWHRFLGDFGRALREIHDTAGTDWVSAFSVVQDDGKSSPDFEKLDSYHFFARRWQPALMNALMALEAQHPRDEGSWS